MHTNKSWLTTLLICHIFMISLLYISRSWKGNLLDSFLQTNEKPSNDDPLEKVFYYYFIMIIKFISFYCLIHMMITVDYITKNKIINNCKVKWIVLYFKKVFDKIFSKKKKTIYTSLYLDVVDRSFNNCFNDKCQTSNQWTPYI